MIFNLFIIEVIEGPEAKNEILVVSLGIKKTVCRNDRTSSK
jgi:hypothetical protein